MSGVADMGMMWVGAGQPGPEMTMGLLSGESNDMLLDHDNPYYTPSHHSMSNQSMEDLHAVHDSHLDHMDMIRYMDVKNESNDSSYIEDDGSQPVYMITTATQTLPCATRKIKPVKHPGLVLKTPIAYQSNTDPSVIPIQKDGIAVCEKCGAIGVKHAFYTRQRRFCSMACARGYSGLIPEPLPSQEMPDNNKAQFAKYRFSIKAEDDFTDCVIDQQLPQLEPLPELPMMDDHLPLVRKKGSQLANSYNWDSHLADQYFVAAPVNNFKTAPMADIWGNIMAGMKVEVENTDCDNVSDAFPDSFWVATVMRIVGYKALLRYEGFGSNDTKDFWVTLCSNQVHPVGWCATRGKPLIPPKTIEDKYSDWKDFLCKRLTGARTLPSNYGNKVIDSLKSRFDCGQQLEVVDKNRISQVKVAIINKIVGKRLNVKYFDSTPDDAGFWCHEDSPLIHPVGWAKKVGHSMLAPISYLERITHGIFEDDDATDELFIPCQAGTNDYDVDNTGFMVGMKLEAIDPLNLSSICAATVMEVLQCGYIMIRIDSYESDLNGADWFCYHINSPCIFPVGFCEKWGIPLRPPNGLNDTKFRWKQYFIETNTVPVNPTYFNNIVPNHGFEPNMKIEAADLMDPRLVCVATIVKIAGRLLKVHFDGWEDNYDQWLDCESPDIYPVGWCQSVCHKLEGPPVLQKPAQSPVKTVKGVKKKGRKKKCKDSSPRSSTSSKVARLEEVIPKEELIKSEGDTESVAEPEASHEEPAIPEQSVTSVEASPPLERKVTSYVSNATSANAKQIPRLVDNSGNNSESGALCPEEWNVYDVAQFLRVNDCGNYCDSFSKQKIDGKALLELKKEDILEFTGGKVGPSLKIFDLIQQLKFKVNPTQVRHLMKTNIKKLL